MSSLQKFIYRNILFLIPLAMGFGFYPFLIFGLIISLLAIFYFGIKPSWVNIRHILTQPGFLLFLSLFGVFSICYRGFYIPYHPAILVMPWGYFGTSFALYSIAILWIAYLGKNTELIRFIWDFCLGSLLFCLLTAGLTALLENPPFYSRAIDIRYIFFDLKRYINTPGIANLLCLFPVAFLAGIILNPGQRPKWFWVIGIIGFIFSLIAALAIGQRSYFLICLVITPLTIGVFLLLLGSWRSGLALLLLLAGYPLLLKIDQLLGTAFLYRPISKSLLSDARFQMFQYWIDRFLENPFQRVEVGPAQWANLQWFHNFFADIHRLSGFWALVAAVILTVFIFYRLVCVIKMDRRFGLFLMAIAIPCFLIMNTSVVPEGEKQPFLLLLAIGAISEVALSREKRRSKIPPDNRSPNPNQEPI